MEIFPVDVFPICLYFHEAREKPKAHLKITASKKFRRCKEENCLIHRRARKKDPGTSNNEKKAVH